MPWGAPCRAVESRVTLLRGSPWLPVALGSQAEGVTDREALG